MVLRAVKHLLNLRIDVEGGVVEGELAPQSTERDIDRLMRHQIRYRIAGLGDDHTLAGRHPLEESREVRLRLVDVHVYRHRSMIGD